MIESTPSKQAVEISVISFLSGSSFATIDSKIYDWIKIGLAAMFAYEIAHFYANINFSADRSHSSSFLVKMTPFDSSKISLNLWIDSS